MGRIDRKKLARDVARRVAHHHGVGRVDAAQRHNVRQQLGLRQAPPLVHVEGVPAVEHVLPAETSA